MIITFIGLCMSSSTPASVSYCNACSKEDEDAGNDNSHQDMGVQIPRGCADGAVNNYFRR